MKTLLSIVAACAPVACAQTETTTVEAPVSDRVVIGLDGQGVPHVRASSREDATYALGYLHGRDRFFQMDLSRRYASGRLAELAGPAMLSGDVQRRMWNFEAVAAEVIADLSETERSLADAYARGVNDGLASLPTRPPEYFFVGAEPEPWTVESSVMTTFSLVEQLSGGGWDERWNDSASKALPAELFAFLHPKGGRLDAPIDGSSVALAPIPGADIVDLRTALPDWPTDDKQTNALDVRRDFVTRGSNNWAVGADRTADGAAILATDPHLGLQLPNVWYRARLEWTCPDGIDHDVVGITLPGFPVVIMGSNGHLAWGMTNVHGDFQDSVVLPDGYETTTREETFVVRGQADETRTFEDTEWGPVVELNDNEGRRIASRWTGAMPEANNVAVFAIHEARTLEEGLDIMASWKSAPQNVAIASSDGRVGLTMSGYLPRRIGFDGTVPTEWSGGVRWAGELPMSARPRFVRDASGYVFSANNRIASVESLAPIGTWFPDGSRAHRIDEVLSREKPVDELDMLALQNDTRTRRHDAWRDLVLERVPADTEDDLLAGARVAASEWSGHADLDEDAHAFVRSVEWAVTGRVLAPFEELVRAHDPNTGRATRFSPDVALRLIAAEPAHLLSPAYDSWDMLVLDGIRSAASSVASRNGGELRPRWGDVHTASIAHPIAQIAGDIMPGLRAPSDGLAGDWSSVRVTGSNFGASVRIVVAPGHEERGVFHMPGGQSGDPRSPHFLDGHAAWVTGEATPLLPGEAVRTITLEPAAP